MIPLSDHNPTSRKAILVPLIIAANVIVFFFVQPSLFGGGNREGNPGGLSDREIEGIVFNVCRAAIPYEVTRFEPISEAPAGALSPDEVPFALVQADECPDKNVALSVLASLFFHGGMLHLAGNMLFLWVFGNNIEDRLGTMKFALFYLAAGIGATVAHALTDPTSAIPLIGASGAIAGVLGAYLVLYPRARIRTLIIFVLITIVELPAALVLGAWFVLQIFQGTGPGATTDAVAYMAHVGGFVMGAAMIYLFRPRPGRNPVAW